jgi:hypothetical protein
LRKNLFFLLRILVTGGIFFIIFKVVPYQELIAVYRRASPSYVLGGLFLIFLGTLIGGLRWKFILNFLGINVSFREALYATYAGNFFNLFFPSLLAGDAFRCFTLICRLKDAKKIVSSVIVDRVSGIIALILLAIGAYTLGEELIKEREVFLGIIIIGLLGVLILSIAFSKFPLLLLEKIVKKNSKLIEEVRKIHNDFSLFRRSPFIFLKLLLCYSIPIHLVTASSFFLLAKAFYISTNLVYFLILVPLIMIIAFLPITVAGMGTRELAAVYFFSKIGIEKSVSLGMSLFNLAFMILLSLAGGIVYVVVCHRWVEFGKQSK